MSRRQRQLDELRRLCAAGAVARAVDLAHQHCADFGPDDVIVGMLDDAIAAFGADRDIRRRCVELGAGSH